MEGPRWRRVLRVACALAACAPVLWQLSLLLRLYLGRVGYPMDIEWLEGAWLYEAHRVKLAQSFYGPPDRGFMAINHPPGYPVTLGLLGHIIPIDYSTARTFSLLCFAGASVLVIRELRQHEEKRLEGWVAGALAVGCAAAGVPLCEGFYDLIREDAYALFLCVLAAVLCQQQRMKPRRIALVACVITLALYTRLPAVFMLTWIVLYVFARHRRTGLLLALVTTSLCGLVLVILQLTSRGWYWMYTVAGMQDHHVMGERVMIGIGMILKHAPFVAALPVVGAILAVRRRLSARAALWLGMMLASVPAALLPFSKVGGFSNDFTPAVFMIGPATLFVASDAVKALARAPYHLATALRWTAFVGLAAFLVVRKYDYNVFLPSQDARSRATALNARIASLEGGVIVPRHPFLPIRNGGKASQLIDMTYLDAAWSGWSNVKAGGYIDKIHARWAIVTGTEISTTAGEIASRYQLDTVLPDGPQMIIGERSQLKYLLRWQDDEKDARVLFDFEEPALEGWTVTGEAFARGTTPAKPRWQNTIFGVVGQKLANSYHPDLRDAAKGQLLSPPFTINRPRMAMRVGGGWRNQTRVELRVDGRAIRKATGIFRYSESMLRVVWDVSQLQGKEARVALIDDDATSWGHLLCDRIVLY